ncbi:hypothetical protein VNO78_04016 [Psophocarpus tetragonolobus]|uniref:Uncharacterized protein n=1 Tax=Psophocarpus tetragonolobus TaxID=3891 RepID=A0AAN9T5C3_PSOTE
MNEGGSGTPSGVHTLLLTLAIWLQKLFFCRNAAVSYYRKYEHAEWTRPELDKPDDRYFIQIHSPFAVLHEFI